MVAAPIQKLWPEYLDASTPDDPSAVVILLTNAVLDSGAPLANLKNGPGSLPHTANKIGNSPAHVGYDVRDCASSYPPPPPANTGSSCGLGCILASEHVNHIGRKAAKLPCGWTWYMISCV